jgi:hypothetical protein
MALARLLVPHAAASERWALGLALSPFAAVLAARALAPLGGDTVVLARMAGIGGWLLFAAGEARGVAAEEGSGSSTATLVLALAVALAAGIRAALDARNVAPAVATGLAGGPSADALRAALHPGAGRVTAALVAAAAAGSAGWAAAELARRAGGGARAMPLAIALVALVSIARLALAPGAPAPLVVGSGMLVLAWAVARWRATGSPRWIAVAVAGGLAAATQSPGISPPDAGWLAATLLAALGAAAIARRAG